MARIRSSRRAVALAALLVLLAAVVVACASSGAAPAAPNEASGAKTGTASSDKQAGGAPSTGGSSEGSNQFAALYQQQIVKTGEVTLQVADVGVATGRVRAMAVELGGYVGGSQAGGTDEATTLTLRIPAARFDDAISRLHEIGDKVLVESTREEDVTSAVVDLNARLKNLQASEVQYRALVAKATRIEDILAVQSRLDDVQGQIEQLTAQLKQLTNQADLATLTVTLQPQPEPIKAASSTWDPGETVSTAVGALLSVGQALVTIGIWLGIVGLPLAIGLAIVVVVLLRLGLVRRSHPPVTPAVPEA